MPTPWEGGGFPPHRVASNGVVFDAADTHTHTHLTCIHLHENIHIYRQMFLCSHMRIVVDVVITSDDRHAPHHTHTHTAARTHAHI